MNIPPIIDPRYQLKKSYLLKNINARKRSDKNNPLRKESAHRSEVPRFKLKKASVPKPHMKANTDEKKRKKLFSHAEFAYKERVAANSSTRLWRVAEFIKANCRPRLILSTFFLDRF